jgi:nucleotide-binding universal stress UspA family protein
MQVQEALRRFAGDTRRRYRGLRRRIRRIERREAREFRSWVDHTGHLTTLSVLLFVPLLIAVVTLLSESITQISFLLFPPLASGTYTLFADPEGQYSSPRRFVGGLTTGAFCGWVALEVAAHFLYHVNPAAFEVQPGAAALGILLTGVVTWTLDLELPTAFSTALLVLITGTSQLAYVVGVGLSSALVAAVFAVWREEVYEERARYLYQTTGADDHVLVPMRGDHPWRTALFGARLAAAHDAGKVVLLDVVDDEAVAAAERATLDGEGTTREREAFEDAATEGEAQAATESARVLEADAERIETKVGVPCEVVVAVHGGDHARTALDAAERTNCDLVVTPYEEERGRLAPFVQGLFRGTVDVVVFRSVREGEKWRRVLVPVRRAGDAAHAMVDYAERLAGAAGTVALCTCIGDEKRRRGAETMLANLAETVTVPCETRVSRTDLARFLRRNQSADLVFIGASTDRSAASRFLSPPTFRRVIELETDVAVVHKE